MVIGSVAYIFCQQRQFILMIDSHIEIMFKCKPLSIQMVIQGEPGSNEEPLRSFFFNVEATHKARN